MAFARRLSYLAKRAATLSPREWRELVRAQWSVLGAHAVVATAPVGSLVESPVGSEPRCADSTALAEAERLARAVSLVARFGLTRPRCLVRSVALARLLRARRTPGAVVRVGVRRTGDDFLAHAWVELNGRPFGDVAAHVGEFVPLTTVRLGGSP